MRRSSFVALVFAFGCGTSQHAAPPNDDDAGFDTSKADTARDFGIGDTVTESDVLADASDTTFPDFGDTTLEGCDPLKNCPGAPLPTWALEDFQPKSTGFKKTYGLSAFKPKVTVVALLAAW